MTNSFSCLAARSSSIWRAALSRSHHSKASYPKGVIHRTRAPEKAVVLMVETATIVPTGDA